MDYEIVWDEGPEDIRVETNGRVDGAELRRRAELVRAQADRLGPQRVAFVVSGRIDLGSAGMLAAYTATEVAFDVRVFPSVPAAREWLIARL
jgi:hypothetical protein